MNSEFPFEKWKAGGSFQKTFRKFVLNLDANASLEKYIMAVNQSPYKVENFGQKYEIGLQSNFDAFLNFEIGYAQHIDQYVARNLKSTYYTGNLSLQAEIAFLGDFTFSADYSFYNYSDKEKTITNNYSFLDAELIYENPAIRWEFGLQAPNLLNVKSIDRDGFNENFSYTSAFFVQPRMFLFSVKYDL